mmetsp:Transcript_23280/g.37933  ORF Transcript_23280/g.37933 Transcript_23280/m.37933 type:complete len:101 (+) Transcript_23280:197-499(+)
MIVRALLHRISALLMSLAGLAVVNRATGRLRIHGHCWDLAQWIDSILHNEAPQFWSGRSSFCIRPSQAQTKCCDETKEGRHRAIGPGAFGPFSPENLPNF